MQTDVVLSVIYGALESGPARTNLKAKKAGAKRILRTDRNAENSCDESTRSENYIDISRGIRASHIKKLRKQFSMTPGEFSLLIGKSAQSLKNWESSKGLLNLQQPSQLALEKAFAMDKAQAWSTL